MDHGGHGGMPMPAKCSMNMLWNYQITDTCVVFRSWHISGAFTFVLSFLIILLLGITYEWLRKLQRALDIQTAQRITRASSPSIPMEADNENGTSPLIGVAPKLYPVPEGARIRRAVLYGLSTFLSFFLMLVFMTYNAYLIAAVVLGASIGHYIYGEQIEAEAILAGSGDSAKPISCC
ncbi:Ctr copper transporter [Clavulina sp. PMI_390]|nr:Ctr copper transporter [Clavulina sp. PMI_390]